MVFFPLGSRFANTRTRTSQWAFGCLLGLAALGCDDPDSDVVTGELGSNQFFYECTTLDDVQCRNERSSFPDAIAVGASFELLPSHTLRSSVFIRPASPHLVSAVAGEFRFLQPSISAFLALHADDGLQDFVHLRAVAVDEIEIQNSFGQAVTQVTLERGRELTLIAVPLGDGEELAGSLSFRWATDTQSVVSVQRRGTEVTLEALDEGTALVRADLDDLSTTIEVTVVPSSVAPSNDPEAGANDDDAGDGSTLDAAIDAGVLDASVDAAIPPVAADASAAPSSTASTAQTETTSIVDAAPPPDAADAQIQAEAGDQ